MSPLTNMTLKTKVSIMVLIPLMALTLFGSQNIWQKRVVSKNMDSMTKISTLAIEISTLIHETQKERGLTAGFLESGGKKYRDELLYQRRRTGEHIILLKENLARLDTSSYGIVFLYKSSEAMKRLGKLDSYRLKVDALFQSPMEAISFYTDMNSSLLATISHLSSLTEDVGMAVRSTAYVNFLKAKERAGVERALLTSMLIRGQFEPGTYRTFSAVVAEQETLFQVFRELATPDQVAFFDDKMASPAVLEMQKLRERIFKGGAAGPLYDLLGELYQNLSLRGIYHSVKNLLIRGMVYDETGFHPVPKMQKYYKEQFQRRFGEIKRIMTQIRELSDADITNAQRLDVEIIWVNVAAYANAVDAIISLQNKGLSPNEIDQEAGGIVAVDDIPAEEAIQRLLASRGGRKLSVEADVWFNVSTVRINLLKEVENRLSSDLREHALYHKAEADTALWIYLAFTLAVIGVAMLMGRMITSNAAEQFRQQEKREREVADQVWLKTAAADIAAMVQQEEGMQQMAATLTCELTPLVSGGHGVLYVFDPDQERYILAGSYGYKEHKNLNNSFARGEGLVGQAAQGNQSIVISEPPSDYITINSALGESPPRSILIVPMSHKGQVLAVLEIASFGTFSQVQRELLDELAPILALTLDNQKRAQQTAELLATTQLQAQKLKKQQKKLRASNEHLQEQTSLLQASEEELKQQSEELRVSNEELEENQAHLRQQKKDIEAAKHEVEIKAQELAQASKYKSEFLANMSHEFRTPLNSLLLLSKGLAENREGRLSLAEVEDANVIYDGGKDLLELINDIMDLSKVEAGMLTVHREEVRLEPICRSIKQLFSPIAAQKELDFSVETDSDLPESIMSDGQRLQQILKNFLSNAFKFTEKGVVKLRIHRPDAALCIQGEWPEGSGILCFTVTDTGVGIPVDKQEAIFEAFQQQDGSTSRKYGGTGLGLTISKEMAALLGGEIQLQSKLGLGSGFTLCLPADLPERLTGPRLDNEATVLVGERFEEVDAIQLPDYIAAPFIDDDRMNIGPDDKSLLVIDDDRNFARILRDHGRKNGYKCLVAGSGRDGLFLAMEHIPNGILLDIGLPDIDGRQVLEQLKFDLKTRHIPVLVISAYDTDQGAVLAHGAIGYLTKPVSREQLEGVLGEIAEINLKDVHNLLIVEDDAGSRRGIQRIVESSGMQISSVATGEEGCAEILSNAYDCVILDLDLPGMSGFEVLKEVHKQKTGKIPPIIVYTGKEITASEQAELQKYSSSVIIKGAGSPERLLDDISLFLHHVETGLDNAPEEAIQVLHDADAMLQGRRVLLVDDDMRNTYALSKKLLDMGLEVEMATDGEQALSLLEGDSTIELILMDIMMPVMDGYETIGKLRKMEAYAEVPIIAVTAKAMPDDQEKCLKAGASEYMTKPVDFEKLLAIMRIWLFKAH